MRFLTRIAIALCNFVYAFHKLAPTRNRIAMISRQSNRLTLDMRLLKEELKRQDPSVEVVTMNRKIPPGISGKIKYVFYLLGPEMHAIATSQAVILEGYSINISILHHKKSLTVIQMWHALGVLKKFAYLAVDTEEGHSSALAKSMHMHENYDYVLCSSAYCRPYYAKAFGYPESQVRVYPLPRTDLLQSDAYKQETRARILEKYPELCNSPVPACSHQFKKNVLYAPTFRNGEDIAEHLHALFEAFNYEEYNLIVKLHPIDRTKVNRMEIFECPEFSTLELFSVSDVLITDYSSVLFEAAVAGLPVCLYTYDLDSYLERRGFIIDFKADIPYPMFADPAELMAAIESLDYGDCGDAYGGTKTDADAPSTSDENGKKDFSYCETASDVKHSFGDNAMDIETKVEAFITKYVKPGIGNTERLAAFVLAQMKE